eukprot:m.243251 g.243251  ORF g.243251 m.243251 type:complete len:85 (+) comp15341_c0_seq3:7030-7284(+)
MYMSSFQSLCCVDADFTYNTNWLTATDKGRHANNMKTAITCTCIVYNAQRRIVVVECLSIIRLAAHRIEKGVVFDDSQRCVHGK